ncbi:MAG TPA: protein translocase subunit SecD, partial [Nocardioides sp.]|nr:protein translocase subunit SecD [Nocardioides sp.]
TDPASPSGSANRAPANYSDTESPSPTDGGSDSAPPSTDPSDTATTDPSSGLTPSNAPTPAPEGGPDVSKPLQWIDAPNQEAIDAFNAFSCPTDGSPANVVDDPDKPLVTCEYDAESGFSQKYLLSAALIEGTDLDNAQAAIPQGQVNYVVQLDFNGAGTKAFTEISKALVNTDKQFAIVLDGQVISAPTMNGLITDGRPQIEGNFTQATAQSLATSLKFGALPVSFADFSVETIGPSLAGDQLRAGITAGLIGLLLVMIYCLIYYRGLGIVVVSSLVVAAAATYAMVLLLSKTANFTLTLPGIAGLIVAVGITADSFIVYFERIRDEMREGRSMRVAVEAGWVRARATCLAADAVSLLAAVVLYIFAAGVVRGFAFALGLSTIIDLVVFFWFTKPLVSVLARYKFFNGGGKLSGLSAESLGIDKITADRPRVATATRSSARGAAEGGTV